MVFSECVAGRGIGGRIEIVISLLVQDDLHQIEPGGRYILPGAAVVLDEHLRFDGESRPVHDHVSVKIDRLVALEGGRKPRSL